LIRIKTNLQNGIVEISLALQKLSAAASPKIADGAANSLKAQGIPLNLKKARIPDGWRGSGAPRRPERLMPLILLPKNQQDRPRGAPGVNRDRSRRAFLLAILGLPLSIDKASWIFYIFNKEGRLQIRPDKGFVVSSEKESMPLWFVHMMKSRPL
jgi:hypothetical protein